MKSDSFSPSNIIAALERMGRTDIIRDFDCRADTIRASKVGVRARLAKLREAMTIQRVRGERQIRTERAIARLNLPPKDL